MNLCNLCDCHELCTYIAQETKSNNIHIRCAQVLKLVSKIVEKNIDND